MAGCNTGRCLFGSSRTCQAPPANVWLAGSYQNMLVWKELAEVIECCPAQTARPSQAVPGSSWSSDRFGAVTFRGDAGAR